MSWSAFQQVGDLQNNVHIILAVIVMVNHFFSFFPADARAPAMTFEKISDAGHRIGMVEQINTAVIVAVFPVRQNVAGHELGIPDGSGNGSRYFSRVQTLLVGIC